MELKNCWSLKMVVGKVSVGKKTQRHFCLRPSAKDQGITRVVVVVVVLVFVLHLVHILIETAGTANSAILWISSAKLPVNNFGVTYLKSSFTCGFYVCGVLTLLQKRSGNGL